MSYTGVIYALRLTDGEVLGSLTGLRARHGISDPASGRFYIPQANSIEVVEWDGHTSTFRIVDTITVFECSADNTMVAFLPPYGARPAHLMFARWGRSDLRIVNLATKVTIKVNWAGPATVTGIAADVQGRGVLVLDGGPSQTRVALCEWAVDAEDVSKSLSTCT